MKEKSRGENERRNKGQYFSERKGQPWVKTSRGNELTQIM